MINFNKLFLLTILLTSNLMMQTSSFNTRFSNYAPSQLWKNYLSHLWHQYLHNPYIGGESPFLGYYKAKIYRQELQDYWKNYQTSKNQEQESQQKNVTSPNITLADVQQAIRENMHNQLEQAAFKKALKDSMQQTAATT